MRVIDDESYRITDKISRRLRILHPSYWRYENKLIASNLNDSIVSKIVNKVHDLTTFNVSMCIESRVVIDLRKMKSSK